MHDSQDVFLYKFLFPRSPNLWSLTKRVVQDNVSKASQMSRQTLVTIPPVSKQ